MAELCSNRGLALNLDIGERLEPLEPTIDVTDPEEWVNYAKRNFDQVYKEGVEGFPKMMCLGLHLRIIGRPSRIWALEEFFRHVRKAWDVWVTTRHSIAQHLAKADPA
jgi:allantoinase